MQYINKKDLGFNPSHVIGFWIRTQATPAFQDEIRMQPSIAAFTLLNYFPANTSVRESAVLLRKDANDVNGVRMETCCADEYMTELLQMKIIAGKNLPPRVQGDTIVQMILNRKAVAYLDMTPEEVIGKRLQMNLGGPVYVCGVVEDFNYESLYNPINEYGIHNANAGRFYGMVRINGNDVQGQIKIVEQIYKKHFPNDLFGAHYLDLDINKSYDGVRNTSQVSLVFSILAILVACLGVFGLTAFMAEQRVKEIGIRKVLGASVISIVSLFTIDYLKLLAFSMVIAIPVAWWVGNRYLEDFTYRISLNWWTFIVSAIITIVLTLSTVCSQAIKAAMANPVEAIKSN